MGDLLQPVVRPVKMDDSAEYQLVTARRSRGGIVARERSLGKNIATKVQFIAREGDFLISRRQISHGACGFVPSELNGALVSGEYNTLLTTDALDAAFLRHLTYSIYFQQTCFHSSIGVHVEKLVFRLNEWLKWLFDIPAIAEQRRIAAVLDTWSEAIATAEHLAAVGWARKRALMRQLFGDAHNPFMVAGERLDAIASIKYGRGIPNEQYIASGAAWVIGTSGIIGRLSQGSEDGAAIVVGRKGTLNSPFYVPEGQPYSAIDTTFILRGIDHLKALFYYLQYVDLSKLNEASGVPSISADTLRSLPVPTLNKRQEELLGASDVSAFGMRDYAEHLRRQKRGLMQKLLTGEWRVPATGDAFVPSGPAADRMEAAE